jgi:hypothetical protein
VSRIVIEIPEKLKFLVTPIERIIAGVERRVVSMGAGGRSVDYGDVEREVAEQAMAIERAAHQSLLSALDVDAPQLMIGGRLHRRVLRSEANYRTMAGPVSVKRSLYRAVDERNGPTVDPVSLRAGTIGQGWLPATAAAIAHAVQMTTSRDAEAQARLQHRLPYSRSSFEDVAHLIGDQYLATRAEVEDELIEAFEVPSDSASVSVSLDRVSVPVEEQAESGAVVRCFRMAYCGTVTLHDRSGDGIHTIRYGRMNEGDVGSMVHGMAMDVAALREKKPRLKVALLADGAPELWRRLQGAVAPEVIGAASVHRLLDFWHVIEKLGAAARVIDSAAASDIVHRWRFLLLNADLAPEAILGELRLSGCESTCVVGNQQPVRDAITYLENNLDLMRYAQARRLGLPIGSGNVEATCKSLVQTRMKRAGARWKQRTGEHIIQLRALALSDRWEPGIRRALKPLRQSVRRVA